eukprot:Amastigsp_a841014_52645.p4 type:complete len:109 gc:universal Amastigsp_a841014_52645:289-615(+)
MTPGTKVFCGEPLMYGTPSRMHATANSVDGETSGSLDLIDAISDAAVSLSPTRTSAKRSVFALQSTMTLSSPLAALKLRMSLRMCSTRSSCEPSSTLLARSAWLAAIK